MEMYEIICDEIEKILKDTKGLAAPILNLHLPKRAKFERYLQSVLANELKVSRKFKDTEIEHPYPNDINYRADIFANDTFIELKTPNTSYNVEDVADITKPITKNIQSIKNDIAKLRKGGVKNGVVAFVLFPIDNKEKYRHYVDSVINEFGLTSFKECTIQHFYVFSAKV